MFPSLRLSALVAAIALASTPVRSAPLELCGDCADTDADGLADDEDPDCCTETTDLGLEALRIRPDASRLAVRAVYALTPPPFFDPLEQDASLTVSDESGVLLCAPMRAGGWRRSRGFAYRFVIRAGTIERATFKVDRDARLRFSARAARVTQPEQSNLRVTLRVGRACARASAEVHQQGRDLVFP